MDGNIAVSVKDVSKEFLLPHEKSTTIKSVFTGVFKGKNSKTYERQHALKNISFEIRKGEFFGIVGRNGSGKSTLLKIIAGIYQPTKGSVNVNGKLVPFIELGVGFNPDLTGRENVYLNGAIFGFSKHEIDQNYQDIVEFSELEEHMDQKLKNYSSGMQVRLAFACATKSKADILLIDEVLAVGDTAFQQKCFDYFSQLKHDKKTVIFVSHDMEAVNKFCTNAIFIDNSEVILMGGVEEVSELYSEKMLTLKKGSDEKSEHKEKIRNLRLSEKVSAFYAETDEPENTGKYKVRIHYVLHEDLNWIDLRVALVRDGIAISHLNSLSFTQDSKKGKNISQLEITKNELLQGVYYLHAGIFDKNGNELAFRNKATKLYISKKSKPHGGFIKFPGAWKEKNHD